MYKKTSESTHYLPRRGSYSTVPHRNGRVDVLPPEAGMPLYDTATQLVDANNRLEQLRKEQEDIQRQIYSLGRIDKLRSNLGSSGSEKTTIAVLSAEEKRIDHERQKVKKKIRELKSLLGGQNTVSIEQVFMRLSESELPPDVFATLKSKAYSIFSKASR